MERYAYSTSDKGHQEKTARANPVSAPFHVLLYTIAELNAIAFEPFFVTPLICSRCREPHAVAIAYLRTGEESFSPWWLYFADSMGSA